MRPIPSMYPVKIPESSNPASIQGAVDAAYAAAKREAMDVCLDVLDDLTNVKERCETIVVAADVDDGSGGLETAIGFKGHPDDVAELLADLIIRFQGTPQGSDRLYAAIYKAKIREDAKRRQKDLDDMDNANSIAGYR